MSKVITDQNSACRSARHEKHRSRPAELYIMPKYPVSGSDKKIARTSQLIARFTKANARYSQRKKTSTQLTELREVRELKRHETK